MTLTTKNIPIAELKVSRLNMRAGRKPPVIDDIYPSIKKQGVLEPMLVRREGKKWGVVAGRRRLFSLRRKAKETGEAQKPLCVVMQPGDDAAAIERSIIENLPKLPPTEIEQYDAFKCLADRGRTVEEIAETFGVTELQVKRILALANLCDEIKALYEAEEIDGATLRALTLASNDQQTEWLKLFHDEDAVEPRGARIKAWLAGGDRIPVANALFDVKDYDGAIITDLFDDMAVFGDSKAFWSRQNDAVAALADRYRENGWSDVVILERGEHFAKWDHEKRTKTAHGKVFIEIRHDGAVTAHEGYLGKADIRKIERILNKSGAGANGDGDNDAVKPEMSGPMAEYVALHRHAVARARLLDHPMIALRLAVAHMIAGAPYWRVAAEPQRTRKETTAESLAASESESLFAEARREACDLLGFAEPDRGLLRANGDDWFLAQVFARLLKLEDIQVMRVLTVAMGESLAAGSASVEAAAHVIGADIGALWSPDDAFFDLLRDKRAINAMLADVAGERTARAMTTDTGKAQKQAIRNRIKGVGGDGRPEWRPGWMAAPPRRLVDGAPCEPADQWERIAGLFAPNEIEAAPEDKTDNEPIAA